MEYLYLIWFSVAWVISLYLLNVCITRGFPRIDLKMLFMYVGCLGFAGVFGEVLIDSLFKIVVGYPFWEYKVLPVHHGFTSYYSMVIWGMFGFHLYLYHGMLEKTKNKLNSGKLALIFALEAVLLEIAVNITHLAITGQYVFYYLPADLWHLTSLTALPLYFIGGFVILQMIKRFKKDPIFFGVLSLVCGFCLVFLTTWF